MTGVSKAGVFFSPQASLSVVLLEAFCWPIRSQRPFHIKQFRRLAKSAFRSQKAFCHKVFSTGHFCLPFVGFSYWLLVALWLGLEHAMPAAAPPDMALPGYQPCNGRRS